jgi:hypothetical protein
MGRVNKTIDGVFVDIVGSNTRISRYDEFINNKEGLKQSKELVSLTNKYKNILNKTSKLPIKDVLKQMADLEEVILQKRVQENPDDIKLTILREYIYARTTFFRRNTLGKDIRVIVGQTTELGDDLKKLSKDKKFMESSKSKLVEAMGREIEVNLSNLNLK